MATIKERIVDLEEKTEELENRTADFEQTTHDLETRTNELEQQIEESMNWRKNSHPKLKSQTMKKLKKKLKRRLEEVEDCKEVGVKKAKTRGTTFKLF